ncbi:MAG: alpha/beta fold hydrolase, partial [Bacteroidota bacterium]
MLIHGFINSASSWEGTALVQQLLVQGYRVIIPDLRGNGMSDKPQEDAAYENDAEIKDLTALIDHLDLDRLMAVGYSRGSILLTKLLTSEQRVYRAVIGGMGLDFTNPDWDRRLAFAAAFGGAELTDLTRGAVEYAQSINADLRSLHLQQKHQPITTKAAIREIRIPVLVVAGKEDLDNGFPGRLEELFPKGKLNIIPGDHNTTYRTP